MDIIPRTVIISSPLSISNFDFYSFLESQKIEKIILQCDYKVIDYSRLPTCVYFIECDKGCWSINPDILPCSITHLSVSSPTHCKYFNINALPCNLKYLSIGFEIYNNNQWSDIDNLPPYLEELRLNGKFNLPCDKLPQGLKKLIIHSTCYNKPFDNLPASLEYLEINAELKILNNKLIFTLLPNGLKTLILDLKSIRTNEKIELSNLPKELKHLRINSVHGDFDFEIEFPEGLEIFDITTNLHNLAVDILPKLPSSLKILKLGKGKNENYNYIKEKYPDINII